MPPLRYHAGQRAIQDEANTRELADHLAGWVGPVADFALEADLLILATPDARGLLRATFLSGPAPLVELGDNSLRFQLQPGAEAPAAGPAGGLAINLGLLRRARINGELRDDGEWFELEATETFTLCRKYMAPSVMVNEGSRRMSGPAARSILALNDPVVAPLLARAETAYLLSAAPDGNPDVAHRGGPSGFLTLDSATGILSWPEFLGDGVFKSAGNVRATPRLTLVVPDPESGDGIEIVCDDARYENILTSRHRRLDPLLEHRDPYPIQGRITASVVEVTRLHALMQPRKRIERALKVTSRSAVEVQAPQ